MSRQSKQSTDLREQYTKRTLVAIAITAMFIAGGFSVFNYTLGEMAAMWINIAMLLLAVGAILAVQFNVNETAVYRFICAGIAAGMLGLMFLGPHPPYFQFVMPLVIFFFLGPREGIIWSTGYLFVVTVLLFAPELIGSYVYPGEQAARLLSCYLVVMLFGWHQASSQAQFSSILISKNEQLQQEHKQSQEALSQVTRTEEQLKQTVAQLQSQSQLLETVLDNMSEGIVVGDAAGRLLFFNAGAQRIMGKGLSTTSTPDQWSETYGVFYPDGESLVPTDELPLVRALRGESTDGFEAFVRNEKRPDGVHVRASARPMRKRGTDEVTSGMVVFRDITRQKETEARLEQASTDLQDQGRLMETVFNSMNEGILVTDTEGRQVFHNPSAERISGMGKMPCEPTEWAEVYGIFTLDQKTYLPLNQNPLVRAMHGDSMDNFEAFVRNKHRPDGVYVSGNGRPILDKKTNEIKAGVFVFRDITEQKKAQERMEQTVCELREQSQLMETMFNSVSDGVVVTDKDGNFLFVNPTAESIVGMGAKETPSDQWSETYGTFYPDGETLFPSDQLPLARAMRGEFLDDVELLIRNEKRPEGVNISVNARPLRDNAGVLKGGMIVFRDVTKLKKTEVDLRKTVHRLQEQTQLMETVFESMNEGIIVRDLKGRQIFHNASADRITGMRTGKEKPTEWAKAYGLYLLDKKTLLPVQENPLARALRGGATDNVEVFVRNENKPNGVYVSATGRPIRNKETGEVTAGVIVFRDITRSKETAAQLEQTIAELRRQTEAMATVFNSISDGVIVADENGNFTIFNPSAERIVGIGSTDTGPDEWTDQYGIFFPDRVTPIPTEEIPLVRALAGHPTDEAEVFIRNPKVPDGVYLSVSGRPLRDDGGEVKGGVVIFRDVTQRALAEEALSQAFSQGRIEIVDTILHNIGNAINSVSIGVGTVHEQLTNNVSVRRLSSLAKTLEAHRDDWISYLQSDPQGQNVMPFILALADDFAKQNAQLKQTIERVDDRVAHIVEIIRTQRSFERETMTRKQVDLRKAVTDAVKLLQESIAKRAVRIQIDCEKAPKEIRIQESKFNQMLVNLIKNGIEAIDVLANKSGLPEQPCIRIRSYVEGGFLVLDVTDNGIGIETKVSKLIFSAGYTTKITGSGLGLHSAANFVIGSGGEIDPLSDGLGKGTTMRVKLRLSSVALQH